MKKDIHPAGYRPVVFKDMSNGDCFLSQSTCNTRRLLSSRARHTPLSSLKFLALLTPSTQVRLSSWIQPVA